MTRVELSLRRSGCLLLSNQAIVFLMIWRTLPRPEPWASLLLRISGAKPLRRQKARLAAPS